MLTNFYSNKTAFSSNEQQNYKCIKNVCEIQTLKTSSKEKDEIPPEYTKAGTRSNDYYYVSEDALPWPQAQYECQSKSGRLAELSKRLIHYYCIYINM